MTAVKIINLTVFLLLCTALSAQKGFYVSAATGMGFNSGLKLNGEPVSGSIASVSEAASAYNFRLGKNLFAETGAGLRMVFAQGQLGDENFSTKTTRLVVPFLIGTNLSDKTGLYAGFTLQNNRDFADINPHENYFWRSNFIVRFQHKIIEKIDLFGLANYGFYGVKDSFLLNDPQFFLLCGLRLKI